MTAVSVVEFLLHFSFSQNSEFWFASIKFGLSEKHTKFEKNLPHDFDKLADLLSTRQNHEKLCVLLKSPNCKYVV